MRNVLSGAVVKGALLVTLLACYTLPAIADPCMLLLTSKDSYRGVHPRVSSGAIACADNNVETGRMNECAVVQFYMDNDKDLKKNIDEDIFTPKGVLRQVDPHINELYGQGISRDPNLLDISSAEFCHAYAKQEWNDRKPDERTLFSKNLTIGRTLSDAVDPQAKPLPVPFILSYQEDRNAHTSATGLYGTIKYTFDQSVTSSFHTWDLAVSVDSTTSQPSSKSSVVVGTNYTALTGSDESTGLFQGATWKLSPQYQTDRDFRRNAYELTGSVTPKSAALGDIGYFIYSSGAPGPDNAYRLFWQPSLEVDVGRVGNDGGSQQLAVVKKDGTYARLVPSVSAELIPYFISPSLTLQLSYRQRFDMTRGWNRGYAEFSTLYRLSKNAYLTAIYRYGRKDVTFDPINTILFGIGFTQ